MISPDIPGNETERLASLRSLEILDTAAEAEFDALARAASIVCGTPISLLSLVDADRQWFKANIGLEGTSETPRDVAFCAHAILGNTLLEIPDAAADLRFHDNPLVTGYPGIRFYAGVPVVLSDGQAVGTLCVIDHEPRQLTELQQSLLQQLAVAASRSLEGRRAARALARAVEQVAQAAAVTEQSEQRLRLVLDNAPSMIAYWDRELRCRFANRDYRKWFGVDPTSLIGTHISTLLGPELYALNRPHLEAALAGIPQSFERMIPGPDGNVRESLAFYIPDIDPETGRILGILVQITDVTLAKQKEAILRTYRDNIESEAEIARFLLARMSRMDSLEEPGISHLCLAAESFSGDLIAVARSSAGDLYGMLVDSTGHGLSAAIHLVPVTTAFYDMAERGFTLDSMARRMNQAIKDYSPPDRFVAVTLVRILAREMQLEVLNAGNPAALLVDTDRQIRRSFRSGSVPLGILDDAAFRCRVEVCRVAEGELLLLCSDGLIEACNPGGIAFGSDGLARAIGSIAEDQDPVAAIRACFDDHCNGASPLDDVTMLALRLPARSELHQELPRLAPAPADAAATVAAAASAGRPGASDGHAEDDWEVSIRFSSAQLRRLDIVPAVMELGRTLGLDDATETRLFLVLNELCTNAIDHGLLGLDSSLKTGPEGLARYFALRGERLQTLTRAGLQIRICRREIPGQPARIALELRDSGSGFDHARHLEQADEDLRQARAHSRAPRGLALVLDLCDCFVYEDGGRSVRAEFPGQ